MWLRSSGGLLWLCSCWVPPVEGESDFCCCIGFHRGERNSSPTTGLFPAVGYKALDYVFEASATLKSTLTLLALPVPAFPGPSERYPVSGRLCDDTYRRPWVRGKVFSSCRLVVAGSVLCELKGNNRSFSSLERFSVWDDVDVIPSSNPDSPKRDDQIRCLFKQDPDLCHESFFKVTADQMEPHGCNNDFFLPEELITPDYVPQLKRRLPTLKATLSRLKMLPVADPLLGPTGLCISEDPMFSCFTRCASYENNPDVDTVNPQICADVQEEFCKEPLLKEELLLLPAVVDTFQPSPQNFSTYSNVCAWLKASPEPLEEQCSVLDVLQKTVLLEAPLDVSQYDPPQGHRTEGLILTELPDDFAPHQELELDSILSPEMSPDPSCLSTSHLQEEDLSPFGTLSLLSARTRQKMEAALWESEKHLTFVANLLLSEPCVQEAAPEFQPLHEAFKMAKAFSRSGDEQRVGSELEILQTLNGHSCEFTEKMMPEIPKSRKEEREEFTKELPEDVESEVQSLIRDSPNEANSHHDTCVDSSHSSLSTQASGSTAQQEKPSATNSTAERVSEGTFLGGAGSSPPPYKLHTSEKELSFHEASSELNLSSKLQVKDDQKRLASARRPERDLDPLLDFIKLRSQQVPGSAEAETLSQPPQREQQPAPEEMWTPNRKPTLVSFAVSADASREHKPAAQRTNRFSALPASQSASQEKPFSRVVPVRATESQRRAYHELQALAQPCLSSARQMGLTLPSWGHFSCLAPDQTHFLLKQQERALCRAPAEDAELLKDQELLFNQAALIHVLVTFKELLLKCDLSTAVASLTKAAEVCSEQRLKQLLKRMQILLIQEKQESNFKLLELQQLLADWLHTRTGKTAEKILVVLSVDSDDSRSRIISDLSQVTGAAVTSLCPDEDGKQLSSVGVVSSICSSDCVVVCEQHIGADFPWSCFSLLVEFDHPGSSPWSAVCSEKSISHLTFTTSIPEDVENTSWCLEDNLPFVLIVTEGLLNHPLLLQTLESDFCVTVLERSHSPTLQMLGGTHNYAVITVDEDAAIVIQEQDELCEERASERLVMRLTALSLQYSYCWLFLHCSDSQGGGLSSRAFRNLVLVYSSLVLFGTKSGELDVKVLIVSQVSEMAEFIHQICFTRLMSSDRDPASYLTRDWLTVLPSQEEECLSKFPCLNPLVSQLMLSRAPSLQCLLRAPLPQLKELLPEVPHKVLKTFTECISLHWNSMAPKHPDTTKTSPPHGPCAHSEDNSPHLERTCSDHSASFLESFNEWDPDPSGFRLDSSCSSCSPVADLQRDRDLWNEEEKVPFWSRTAEAAGRVVMTLRASQNGCTSPLHTANSPFQPDPAFSCSPILQQPASSQVSPHSTIYSHLHHSQSDNIFCNPPSDVLWGQSGSNCLFRSREMTASSPSFSYKCWRGQERKRSSDVAGLRGSGELLMKRGRLSYERVPGRRDGQTRLKLFSD
nr:protein shortage in chiasmata 1 ortholog isoform X2 [Nothobranchius furzeri]